MKMPMSLFLSLFFLSPVAAFAQDDRAAGLFTEARQLPLLSQTLTVEVLGGEARVDVVQSYFNDGESLAQADFRMPLPTGAAVEGFGFWRGERYLASELREKAEAEARHAKAAAEGRASGIAKASGPMASFSVHPVEAGQVQRVRVVLRLPVTTELGSSHLDLPAQVLIGQRELPTTVDVRIRAERPLASWRFDGGTPVVLSREGRQLRLVATLDGNGSLEWREARAPLELGAVGLELPEGDHGLLLKAYLAPEAYDDVVRPAVVFVDASFSMRLHVEDIETAVRRVGPGARLIAVAASVAEVTTPDELLEVVEGGGVGHSLDPFALMSALRNQGCDGGGRCLVLTDAAGAAEYLHGVEVPALAFGDAEAFVHFGERLPNGVTRHRRVDGAASLGARVDGLIRPSLEVVSIRAGSEPVDVLSPRWSTPAGSVLRLPLRVAKSDRLEVELRVGGHLQRQAVAVVGAAEEASAVRRAVYRAELSRMMKRYQAEVGTPQAEALRKKVVELSLRENIATSFTARQVDDPELSLAAIKGGDPHLTLADRPNRVSAVAVYPFGEVRTMVRDETRHELVDRFLAPRHWREHAYRVDVHERFDDGRTARRHAWYLLDDEVPQVSLQEEEGQLVVRTEDMAGVSMVRILHRGAPLALAPMGDGWRVALSDLPTRFELEVRDRAGNRVAYRVRRTARGLQVAPGPRPVATPSRPARLVDAEVSAAGKGRFGARLESGVLTVRTPSGPLPVQIRGLDLGSVDVQAHLDLGKGRHLVGFDDGAVLDVDCGRTPCLPEVVRGTSRAHPVRGLARYRGRILVAVLGVGLRELQGDTLVETDVDLPTRFVTDVVSFGKRAYVSTLYDGLWRIVGRRGIKTRFSGSHVDRLDASGTRLVLHTASGRFIRVGTDRFVAAGPSAVDRLQDDLMAAVEHEGKVYFGGFDSGLYILERGRLVRAPWSFEGGARAGHVNALCSHRGSLYVGTEAGLFKIEGARALRVDTAPVHDLASGPKGLAVASGRGLKLLARGADELSRLDAPNAGARAAFSAVGWFEGTLYAGSIDGLYRVGPKGLRPIGTAEGFDGGWVTALRAHEGRLHVGTYAHGVWRGRARFEVVAGLEDVWMPFHGLRPLPDGGLWVGALGQAPRVLRSEAVESWPVPARDSNDVVALGAGRYGLATSAGWVQLNVPAALAAAAPGRD